MHITSKGQVTIPQQVRIRKTFQSKGLGARGQSALSGATDARMSTDEIMALTRGGGIGGRKAK